MAQVNYVNLANTIAARTAAKYGIDPAYFKSLFAAQINQESGFNPNARSGAGAQGIAQIVPKYHPGVNPYNPQQALAYAANWDAQNFKKYGDAQDVLSVYNSGRPWAQGQRIGETNNYVKSILSRAQGSPNYRADIAWGTPGQGKPKGGKPPTGLWGQGNPSKGNMALIGSLLNNALSLSGHETLSPAITAALTARGSEPDPVFYPPSTDGKGGLGPLRPPGKISGLKLTQVPSGFATRPGIELNAPVLRSAESLAKQFGVKINSGYRSPEHNASVGGAKDSDHLSGNAVDFTGSTAAMRALYNYALRSGYAYVEPWSQAGGSHVHISFARNKGVTA